MVSNIHVVIGKLSYLFNAVQSKFNDSYKDTS